MKELNILLVNLSEAATLCKKFPNAGNRTKTTPYLDTFHAVPVLRISSHLPKKSLNEHLFFRRSSKWYLTDACL